MLGHFGTEVGDGLSSKIHPHVVDFDGDEDAVDAYSICIKSEPISWFKSETPINVPHPSCRWSFQSKKCQSCQTKTTLKCSRCKTIFYCSRSCQIRDFSLHRHLCRFLLEKQTNHLPKKRNLLHNAEYYGRGSIGNDVDQNKTLSVIYLIFFYNESGPFSFENWIQSACTHQDTVLLRFLLQCGVTNHLDILDDDCFSNSHFSPDVMEILLEYKQPCLFKISRMFRIFGTVLYLKQNPAIPENRYFLSLKDFAVWCFEQCKQKTMSETEVLVVFMEIFSGKFWEALSIFVEAGFIDIETSFIQEQIENRASNPHYFGNEEEGLQIIHGFINKGLKNRSKIPQSIENKKHYLIFQLEIPSVLVDIVFQYAPETLLF